MTRKMIMWLLGLLAGITLTWATWVSGALNTYGNHLAEHHQHHQAVDKFLDAVDKKIDRIEDKLDELRGR